MPTAKQEEIADMYQAGATLQDIFMELHAYAPQVYAALAACGVEKRGRGAGLNIDAAKATDEKWNTFARKVLDLYFNQDFTAVEISRQLKVGYPKVLRVLHEHRVQLFPGKRNGDWKMKRQQVLEHLEGLEPGEKIDIEAIQNEFGVSLDGIYKILQWRENERRREGAVKIDELRRHDTEALVDEVVRRIRDEFNVLLTREGILTGTTSDVLKKDIGVQMEFPLFDVGDDLGE